MQRVVSFYEKLPRGPAPEPKITGPTSWYYHKYFGKKPSPMREWHRFSMLDKFVVDVMYSAGSYDRILHSFRLCAKLLLPSA